MLDEVNLSKAELERQMRFAAAKRRTFKKYLIALLVVVILGAGVYWFIVYSRKQSTNLPGVAYELLPASHIAAGAPHPPYNSNPPTSGPHYEQPAPWGFYDHILPDEQVVHNLEHGGIWISYKDANDGALVDQLKALGREYSLKVIITLRPQDDTPLAVVAWGRLLNLESFDRDQIKNFIRAYLNKGPEQVPF